MHLHMPARGKDVEFWGNVQCGNRAIAAYVTVYANKYQVAFADRCVDIDPNAWCIIMHHCTAYLASLGSHLPEHAVWKIGGGAEGVPSLSPFLGQCRAV